MKRSSMISVFLNAVKDFKYKNVGIVLFFIIRFSLQCFKRLSFLLFCDEVPYHKETSSLIYRAKQLTGFDLVRTSVMKKLIAALLAFGII